MMKHYTVGKLVEEYGKRVFNLAFRITANRQDAEDITQETFLQVTRKLYTFQGKSHVFTWIYRIALNYSLQAKRRMDRAYIDSLDDKVEQFRDDIPNEVRNWEADPEKRYLFEELTNEIRRQCYFFMTFRLTDEQRVVYVLKNILGLPLKTIAETLEIDENTVKARVHRAKENLIKYFRENCGCIHEDNKCSCRSRIGFALAYAPQLLDRVKSAKYDTRTKKMLSNTLKDIQDIDQIYQQLPMHEYNSSLLIEIINSKDSPR
ncbi:MAG: RNA polymerase sigma factor [Spirochaetota bacterium]|nr:MAG: RNA polymerase sigma factor [Spirochaetota bacterium]